MSPSAKEPYIAAVGWDEDDTREWRHIPETGVHAVLRGEDRAAAAFPS